MRLQVYLAVYVGPILGEWQIEKAEDELEISVNGNDPVKACPLPSFTVWLIALIYISVFMVNVFWNETFIKKNVDLWQL